ncbi:alpha/beta hydrolase [Brachyspira hyodysenteriae]|nr:alpha/beta hydrolase [Brachyspira hyodysenteriae]MDA1470355.1 alpha/beta hydrolase [Brachyspira hyodysenteriae]
MDTTPVLLIAGDRAHSRYYSEDVYNEISGNNKELVIIENADHVSLYDDMSKIPFEKITQFFNDNLK